MIHIVNIYEQIYKPTELNEKKPLNCFKHNNDCRFSKYMFCSMLILRQVLALTSLFETESRISIFYLKISNEILLDKGPVRFYNFKHQNTDMVRVFRYTNYVLDFIHVCQNT